MYGRLSLLNHKAMLPSSVHKAMLMQCTYVTMLKSMRTVLVEYAMFVFCFLPSTSLWGFYGLFRNIHLVLNIYSKGRTKIIQIKVKMKETLNCLFVHSILL